MGRMLKNISNDTVKNNLCIGCGICSVVCPKQCIYMKQCSENWEKPEVDEEECVECGECLRYCPHTFKKVVDNARRVSSYKDPKMYGLNNAWYYTGHVKNESERKRSASGGMATFIVQKLLTDSRIDVVIHGEMLMGRTGELHYGAALSVTVEEIDRRRSSFYSVFSFNKVLNKIKKDKNIKSLCVIGVPCIVSALITLINEHDDYRHVKKIYSVALACSHNVAGAFIDYLADSLRIDRSLPYYVDLRNKDGITNANNYNNHFFAENETIVKINRFESEFTSQWRNYSFAMNICNCCSDFWGVNADITVKDAWGKWASEEPLNKSILVVRNSEINDILLGSDEIVINKERLNTVYESQKITCIDKMEDACIRKSAHNSARLSRITFLHKLHDDMRKQSFALYKQMKVNGYNDSLKVKAEKASLKSEQYYKKKKDLEERNKRRNWYRSLITDHNKILVVGGYGGNNIGDEAQLDMVIRRLNRCFPKSDIRVMTPNIISTMRMHDYYDVTIASRVALFHVGLNDYYGLMTQYDRSRGLKYNARNFRYRVQYRLREAWVWLNAKLISRQLPPFMLSAEAVATLNEIRSARLLYFEGGGYLTGATLSRLWEGMFLCRVANLFKVPVVMSGQTIGVWGSHYDKKIAAKGLKFVSLLTLRDKNESLKDLADIGIEQTEDIYTLCDDALFCNKVDPQKAIETILNKSGLPNDFVKNGYVVLCGSVTLINSKDERINVWKKLRKVMDFVLEKTCFNILVFATAPNEAWEMKELLRFYDNPRVGIAQQNYVFSETRGLIAGSQLCITMKHHPIVFSLGECIPVISLAATEYFEHKNRGALSLFDLERFSVNLCDEKWEKLFMNCLQEILEVGNEMKDAIKDNLKKIEIKTRRFEERLIDIYDNSSSVVDIWHK